MWSFIKLSIVAFTSLLAFPARAQSLYSKSFGIVNNEPIIFLHGGPGSSSVYFEATTAQKLADEGFYVVVYDRRGEGRSADSSAKMNYEEFFEDLNRIYQKYHLTRAHLIGFSFGGLVTSLFAEKYPKKVKSIILASALISQQDSYNTILNTVGHIYQVQLDTINLGTINKIRRLGTNSLAYRTEVFAHASRNGFFSLQNPAPEAQLIYSTYKTDTLIKRYIKNERAVEIFWKNERRKNIDVTPVLQKLAQAQMPIYAIYGKQDGLYSKEQVAELQKIAGTKRLKYFDNCSHTVFIDQQMKFLKTIRTWLNPSYK